MSSDQSPPGSVNELMIPMFRNAFPDADEHALREAAIRLGQIAQSESFTRSRAAELALEFWQFLEDGPGGTRGEEGPGMPPSSSSPRASRPRTLEPASPQRRV